MEQPVAKLGALHLDEVGQLEAALEGPRGDAAVKNLAAVLFGVLVLLALDRQHVAVRLDRDVLVGKARYGHRDAIGIVAGALDIVGRIALAAFRLRERIKHREEPVEADGGTVER